MSETNSVRQDVLLAVEGLSAGYGGPPVLEGVEFSVAPGERVGVLGPNGGGKSTLFRVVLGELRPLAGTVDVRARCGIVPQSDRSRLDFPVTALDVALMGSLARRGWWRRPGRAERRRATEALAAVDLADLADRTYGELSGGQRQRVLIARALVQDAAILLLDEPFTGVDEQGARRLLALLDALAADGRAVLTAIHDVELARVWDRVLCLNRRQVAFGAPEDALTLPVLESTYGGDIIELPGGEKGARGVAPPHHH